MTSEVTLLRQQLADSLQQVSILRKQNEASSKGAELTSSENETLKKEITSLHAQLVHRLDGTFGKPGTISYHIFTDFSL